MYVRLTFATLAVGSLLLSSTNALATQHHTRHAQRQSVSTAATPSTAAVPPVPAHEAAVAPQVTYENSQLLIDAKNSTLGDVLHAVEKNTGASFDIGSGDTSERVVGRIGPGPARDVLADLLNGSHFNYVMLSPAADPSALSKVILTPKGTALAQNGSPQEQPYQNQQFQQPVQISPALQVQQQNASADESADNGDAQDDNADADQGDQADSGPADQQVQPQVLQQVQPGVKTPEQLLQEMRQQQQQQQQQLHLPGQNPPESNQQ
jgi:hypothetical protein